MKDPPTSTAQANLTTTNQEKLVKITEKGATATIDDAIGLTLDHICSTIAQFDDLTLDKAFEKCFIVFCMNGAEHNNTGKSKENFITY